MIQKIKASKSEKLIFTFIVTLALLFFGSFFLIKDKCLFVKDHDLEKTYKMDQKHCKNYTNDYYRNSTPEYRKDVRNISAYSNLIQKYLKIELFPLTKKERTDPYKFMEVYERAKKKTKEHIKKSNCQNSNNSCNLWALKGECSKNPLFMSSNCKLACGFCKSGGCSNFSGMWGGGPSGRNYSYFTLQGCKITSASGGHTWLNNATIKGNRLTLNPSVSWGTGGTLSKVVLNGAPYFQILWDNNTKWFKKRSNCTDKNNNCEKWANSGECKKNPSYMDLNCTQSCGLC